MTSSMPENGPIFGVDYYPEQWDPSLWGSDVQRMREMGIRVVRLMEFAWSLLEPKEGVFDFGLFDEVVELIASHDMQVVLGTPTATLPAWLVENDPTVLRISPAGKRYEWGARREACYNAPAYRQAARAIVEKVAKHYAAHPQIVGWQIDNEVGHEGSDVCICEHCKPAWHRWLEKRYQTIEDLNKTWGNVFWGRTLTSFAQVPIPSQSHTLPHNPGLLLDYDRFSSDSATDFVSEQVAIVRKHVPQTHWVSTNLCPPPLATVIDPEHLTKEMDFVGYDNYPVWGDMDAPFPYYFNSFVMSFLRGLKKNRPFALFEQYSDFQGHTCLGYRASVSETVFWTNHAIAHGANQVLYFRWRTAPYGQEQLCHGILGPDNQESDVYRGLQENIRGFAQSMQGFVNVPVASDACVLYDADNARVLAKQNLSKELSFSPVPYMEAGYLKELARYFVPFSILSVNADVCSVASVDLDQYRLIVLPLYQMTDPAFVERLTQWVKAGGTLVLGYRSGARNMINHSVDAPLPGCFADLAGVRVESFESLNEEKVRIRIGAVPTQGEIWADVLHPVQAKAIAHYRDRRKHYSGRACITVNKSGDGQVFYMGTAPGKTGLLYLYWKFLRAANLRARFWGPGIEIVRRQDEEGNDLDVVLNHNPRRAWVRGGWLPAHGARVVKV